MKKIPGTLYNMQIKKNQDLKYIVEVWNKDQIIYEKSGITDQSEIIEILLEFLEKEDFILPRNRLEWVIKDELENVEIEKDKSFAEKTVSMMMGEIEKKQGESIKKIILMGLSNAGKTCIYERIFEGKKPWELMHSTATKGISHKQYSIGSITKPMIWDLGGQNQYLETYHGDMKEKIFDGASILIYVIDLTDISRFDEAKREFEWSAEQIKQRNPNAKIYSLLHKIDNLHDKKEVLSYAKDFFTQKDYNVQFFSTSIMDESLFIAWSEVIREISPKSVYINNYLKQLKELKYVSEALLVEKSTGLACGSTIDSTLEDTIIGMISLLIITIEKVSNELKMKNIKELNLTSDEKAILLINVNSELLLAILLTKEESLIDDDSLKKIKEIGNHISSQINKLWE